MKHFKSVIFLIAVFLLFLYLNSCGGEGNIVVDPERKSNSVSSKSRFESMGKEELFEGGGNLDSFPSEIPDDLALDEFQSFESESQTEESFEEEFVFEPPATDNSLPPPECKRGEIANCILSNLKGICRNGIKICIRVGKTYRWSSCKLKNNPVKEKCNGLDDDCDGSIDEDCDCKPGTKRDCYGGPKNTAGVGRCKRGVQYCESNGKYGRCIGEVLPVNELCNGIDDDCDGKVDEELTRQCRNACGKGIETCQSGVWKNCSAPRPQREICDGKDNDCDGSVDEGCQCRPGQKKRCYTGPKGTEGKGRCKGGVQDCDNSGKCGLCKGQVLPSKEICNQLDDDCDGKVDEGLNCSGGGICKNYPPYPIAIAKKALAGLGTCHYRDLSVPWYYDQSRTIISLTWRRLDGKTPQQIAQAIGTYIDSSTKPLMLPINLGSCFMKKCVKRDNNGKCLQEVCLENSYPSWATSKAKAKGNPPRLKGKYTGYILFHNKFFSTPILENIQFQKDLEKFLINFGKGLKLALCNNPARRNKLLAVIIWMGSWSEAHYNVQDHPDTKTGIIPVLKLYLKHIAYVAKIPLVMHVSPVFCLGPNRQLYPCLPVEAAKDPFISNAIKNAHIWFKHNGWQGAGKFSIKCGSCSKKNKSCGIYSACVKNPNNRNCNNNCCCTCYGIGNAGCSYRWRSDPRYAAKQRDYLMSLRCFGSTDWRYCKPVTNVGWEPAHTYYNEPLGFYYAMVIYRNIASFACSQRQFRSWLYPYITKNFSIKNFIPPKGW